LKLPSAMEVIVRKIYFTRLFFEKVFFNKQNSWGLYFLLFSLSKEKEDGL